MGRFAFIGDEYLNTDHILSITIQESDNTMLHIPFASCHLHGKILPLCR